MAKIFGFVAEFNPFHNGHKQFIDEIRNKYHPDVLIAVMSGNFVQRGDFAVMDKWQRSKIAVDNGVDLVVELPFSRAVQPADLFTMGAVKLLNQLGVTDLIFGTEELIDFQSVAKKISNLEFKQQFNQTYAENLHDSLLGQGIDTTNKPNQLLGLNYAKAIDDGKLSIDSHAIVREDNGFSATKIRKQLEEKDFLSVDKQVPEDTSESLKKQSILTWNDFYPFLRYKILTNSTNDLQLVYQMVEGLNFKVKKEIVNARSFEDFIFSIKSKRYTLARIRRLLMYVLMNVEDEEMNSAFEKTYLRVLSFNSTGQEYLSQIKSNLQVPLITKVGKPEREIMSLELKVDSVRKLIDDKEENFGVIPYIKGED